MEGIRAVAYRKKVKSDTKGMEAAMVRNYLCSRNLKFQTMMVCTQIDLWTLGQCKHVIVTGGSTYR